MFAVIQDRGKQYAVRAGERVRVDRLDAEPGTEVVFDRVLLVADGDATRVGQPTVEGVSVTAKVVGEVLDKKLIVFKKKRRKKYRRKHGHRQPYTDLVVEGIGA